MSKDKTIPQAFPYSGVGDDSNYSKGMTLRDYFAGQALQGILAGPVCDGCNSNVIAGWAYIQADCMLKERVKS